MTLLNSILAKTNVAKVMMLSHLIFAHLLASTSSYAQEQTIQAAVADGFHNGLHAKYLHYIAKKLSLQLSTTAMPFARRYEELKKGRLDIMIGIQHAPLRSEEVTYLYPAYESLTYQLYALTKNSQQFQSYDDIQGKIIGINRHSKYFDKFDDDKTIIKFSTTTLRQKIDLLVRGRTDLFIHYEQSTQPKLIARNLTSKVAKTPFQPGNKIPHFIAISNNSILMARKTELEQIIVEGIENNDIYKIRVNHYAKLH